MANNKAGRAERAAEKVRVKKEASELAKAEKAANKCPGEKRSPRKPPVLLETGERRKPGRPRKVSLCVDVRRGHKLIQETVNRSGRRRRRSCTLDQRDQGAGPRGARYVPF